MSLAAEDKMDFEKAAKYCLKILQKLMPVKSGDVININIPQLSKCEPKGVRVVPQSSKGFDEHYISKKNEQGQTVFQLAGGPHRFEETPADATSLADGFITITALAIGMTDHAKTNELKKLFDDQYQSSEIFAFNILPFSPQAGPGGRLASPELVRRSLGEGGQRR